MMKDSPAEPPKPAEKPNAQPTETKQSQKARVAEPQSGSEKSDSDGESDSEEEKSMVTPDGRVPISPDALRMRCRRLCERKPSGRLQVEASMSDAYKAGGEQREALEMTLLESLATHGHGRSSYKKIKADFVKRFRLVKECLESRESEVHGKWMTEEAMKKSGKYSQTAIKNITSYCRKFPESLMRAWKYNDKVSEFYVITDDTTLHKKADTTRDLEETDLGEPWRNNRIYKNMPVRNVFFQAQLIYRCMHMHEFTQCPKQSACVARLFPTSINMFSCKYRA
ncbi:unnamed protein product [Cladocopium goreaui]|uniref:Uncharacterized protein n=1 Tax=Cladocopium goreaui TaxID=2562237 RepID=A0A9P1GN79_9DINO|nr:unnamed protein product [Cladocopium goreaui]